MKTLNIIGAGRVGRTLAALWEEKHIFTVQDLLDGTLPGARSAAVFIGEGKPVERIDAMNPADLWMITTPDRHIVGCCDALAASGLLRPSDVVFHCSGSMSSVELRAAAAMGARTASVHPLKTFADPHEAMATFAGTYCASEGNRAALEILHAAFECIGARVSEIDPSLKTMYHAASVIVCNYLTALMEAGLRCYEKAGLTRDTASAMMEPIVRETLDHVFGLGTVRALTGPIARGDDAVVEHELRALAVWNTRIAGIYRELGRVALELARVQGGAGTDALDRIESLLDSDGQDARNTREK